MSNDAPTRTECPQCGTRYKVPHAALGRIVKCKKCSATFTLAAPSDDDGFGVIPLAPEGESFAMAAEQAAMIPQTQPFVPTSGPDRFAEYDAATAGHGIGVARPKLGYGQSILWTLLFPSDPHNLVYFMFIWFGLAIANLILPFALLLGWLASIMITGFYLAFCFKVIESAANGEEELPSLDPTGGVFDNILIPIVSWIGSLIVVMLPAIAYAAATGRLLELAAYWAGGAIGLVLSPTVDVLGILVVAGLFFWPIIVLCVALGGFPSVVRIDLIVRTIAACLLPYLLTVAFVYGADFLNYAVQTYFINKTAGTQIFTNAWFSATLVAGIVGTGIAVYADIVAMRAIGLLYHHHKTRFAWNWG